MRPWPPTRKHARIGLAGLLDLPQRRHPPGLTFPGGCRALGLVHHKSLMVVCATAHGPIAVDHSRRPPVGGYPVIRITWLVPMSA
jgi:hypothetical protein